MKNKSFIIFTFVFCILALYLVTWYQKPTSKAEYLGDGITKTTIVHDNIVLEEYTKNFQLDKFSLTYYIQKGDRSTNYNLYDLPKYAKFIEIAKTMTELSTEELNEDIDIAFELAEQFPRRPLVQTESEAKGRWQLHWEISQELEDPQDIDDNIPYYISLKGEKLKMLH